MKLPPTLTLDTAARAASALRHDAAAAAGGTLVIDASALTRFDSSALALLLQARRQAQAAGRPFAVLDAPAPLTQLARLYGVHALLGLAGE